MKGKKSMNFMFAGIGEDYRKVINKFDEKQKKH